MIKRVERSYNPINNFKIENQQCHHFQMDKSSNEKYDNKAYNLPRNQRQRSILLHLNNTLINHSMMTITTEVVINYLMGQSVFNMNLTRQYIDV